MNPFTGGPRLDVPNLAANPLYGTQSQVVLDPGRKTVLHVSPGRNRSHGPVMDDELARVLGGEPRDIGSRCREGAPGLDPCVHVGLRLADGCLERLALPEHAML